jgi:hypothetical protein
MADDTTTRAEMQRARAQALGLPLHNPPFPRPGLWVIWQGVLAIIAAVGRWQKIPMTVPVDPNDASKGTREILRDAIDTSDKSYVELQLVEQERPDADGRLGGFKRVSDALVEQLGVVKLEAKDSPWPEGDATFVTVDNEIRNVPTSQIEQADWSIIGTIIDTRNGGDPRPSNLAGYRMGYILSEDELATLPEALAAEHQAKIEGAFLSSHPDAQELEARIAERRAALELEINADREALHSSLLAQRNAATSPQS